MSGQHFTETRCPDFFAAYTRYLAGERDSHPLDHLDDYFEYEQNGPDVTDWYPSKPLSRNLAEACMHRVISLHQSIRHRSRVAQDTVRLWAA